MPSPEYEQDIIRWRKWLREQRENSHAQVVAEQRAAMGVEEAQPVELEYDVIGRGLSLAAGIGFGYALARPSIVLPLLIALVAVVPACIGTYIASRITRRLRV